MAATSVNNVAKYILESKGEMTAMKLEKLCYYSQAWSLVWDEEPLFTDEIQAWANGPVVPTLYEQHKGRYFISPQDIRGDSSELDASQKETVDAVLEEYGRFTAIQLSQLAHEEQPWKEARIGCQPMAHSHNVISLESMGLFYSELYDEIYEQAQV